MIYLVRHGETEANKNKIVAGHHDSPLTEAGERQAKQRGLDLKRVKFDAVFSSDLIRAKRTAELISADRQLVVNTHRLIRERFFGHWEGQSEKKFLNDNQRLFELKKQLTEEQKRNFKYSYAYESDNQIADRMLLFLRELAVTFLGKTLLVVAHGSIMRSTLMRLGYAVSDELPAGSIENTGYVVLQSDGVDFFVKETKGINKVQV
ncbi:MAG: histidine phosphatase family protein [Patescibacteria group bacterium]|nr:histidine phosphatase family protein [Patescibacteria group bacterium]